MLLYYDYHSYYYDYYIYYGIITILCVRKHLAAFACEALIAARNEETLRLVSWLCFEVALRENQLQIACNKKGAKTVVEMLATVAEKELKVLGMRGFRCLE